MACAIVTAAGTPKRCWAAIAPGAIWLMNACCARVPGTLGSCGAVYLRYGACARGAAGAAVPRPEAPGAPVRVAGAVSPGMSALCDAADAVPACPARAEPRSVAGVG